MNLLLFLYAKFLLQLFRVLNLLLLQLFLEVGVAQHVVFTKTVDLVVGVSADLETTVLRQFLGLYLARQVLCDELVDFPFAFLEDVGVSEFVFEFVEEFEVHEVAVHVLFEHLCVYEVFAAEFKHFLLTHEFILVIDHFAVLLLQFFGDVVHVGHPFRAWTQLRDEVASDLGLLEGGEDESARIDDCEHVD
jgi:hypothetical protein